ncbi:MAG: 50S ribosome-binding GTPase, partial [Candidatus Hydrogenedentes bacterium]|nr:50S ribosome-binding GTPase [Candidatus Hydrogenedentota bacterium]
MDNSFEIVQNDDNCFQNGISGFNEVLCAFAGVLEDYPRLRDAVFEGCEEWRRLLSHKLAPQLSGDGCLVVAVSGGTNTGKSTVFNMLLRDRKSAACSTAAATCAPVLASSGLRSTAALEGLILPEFSALPLEVPEDATRYEMEEDTLWVTTSSTLPDSLALLDTPDVDSIEKRNWKVADHIRAAGDVIVAVLTPEKYKDARVVDFFRQAHASGR